MCFTNPICTLFIFFVSLSLTANFQNLLKRSIEFIKIAQIAYKISTTPQQKLSEGGDEKTGGSRENWGEERHGCWGIVAPGDITSTSHKSSHHSQSTRHNGQLVTVNSSHDSLHLSCTCTQDVQIFHSLPSSCSPFLCFSTHH